MQSRRQPFRLSAHNHTFTRTCASSLAYNMRSAAEEAGDKGRDGWITVITVFVGVITYTKIKTMHKIPCAFIGYTFKVTKRRGALEAFLREEHRKLSYESTCSTASFLTGGVLQAFLREERCSLYLTKSAHGIMSLRNQKRVDKWVTAKWLWVNDSTPIVNTMYRNMANINSYQVYRLCAPK